MSKRYHRSVLSPDYVMGHNVCNTPLEQKYTESRALRKDYCPTCKKFINAYEEKDWMPEPKERGN